MNTVVFPAIPPSFGIKLVKLAAAQAQRDVIDSAPIATIAPSVMNRLMECLAYFESRAASTCRSSICRRTTAP
jgi:hypothetical protein